MEPNSTLAHGLRCLGRLRPAAGMDRASFDPDAAPGQSCQWSFIGAVPADGDPRQFVTSTPRALAAATTTVAADCRELRIVVPSDPANAKAVVGPEHGDAQIIGQIARKRDRDA